METKPAPPQELAPEQEGTCQTVYVNERRVAEARAAIPQAEAVQDVADAFAVLADPTRLRILVALSTGELCVCDLAKVVDRSMPATSHQLKLLRGADLVKYRMAGKLAYYSVADAWTNALLQDALRTRIKALGRGDD